MKHAFLIMAHAYPEQLARLVKSIVSDNHYVFVNIDKKTQGVKIFTNLIKDSNVYFIDGDERMSVQHGCYSQVECTLRMIRKAISTEPNIDYFHLMSGMDYMCVSPKNFDNFFKEHAGETFMHFDSKEELAMWRDSKYRNRVCTWHFGDLFPSRAFPVRAVKKSLQIMFDLFVKRKMIDGIVGGWNWFSWHRSVADYVLNYHKEHPEYFKRWHYTHCCDELVFHTLLYTKLSELNIVSNSLRFIEWHPKREYKSLPLVLRESEYDEIVSSGCLICRKVNEPESRQLLDMLDKKIHI